MPNNDLHVAEMPGLHGPFTMTERVVQKIWLRGDFDRSHPVLADGRPLEIESPGRWNLLAGPDFQNARLRIAGRVVRGDIEVHFHARDWRAHGHADDPAYANVALHVVLFPPMPGERPACRADGTELPTLVLLPWLHRGLEEYGSDDALESLTERDEWQHYAELAVLGVGPLRTLLGELARRRWRQKVHFAKMRRERLGAEAALHHTALEILGYRANRAPMLAVAGRYPLAAWRSGVDPEELAADPAMGWQRVGVRPANLPRVRLGQYARWVAACPDWPERLSRLLPELPLAGIDEAQATRLVRRERALARCRERFVEDITGGGVGGTRLDNLVCDGFLPAMAAEGAGDGLFGLWFHWWLGDLPPEVRRVLGKLAVVNSGEHPHCHGWGQGMLGWFLARAAGASS